MANTRTFYAVEQVAFKDNAAVPTSGVAYQFAREYPGGAFANAIDQVGGLWEVAHGVQSISVTTNFETEQAFQLGQLELYEIASRQPSVECTVEKVIDGTKPVFFMVTDPAFGANIVGRTQTYRADIAFAIYSDTQTRVVGNPQTLQTLSGMYVSNIQYTFPIDGPVTEQISLVGNDKLWAVYTAISGQTISTIATPGADPHAPEGVPQAVIASGGVTELAGGAGVAGSTVVIGSGIQRREKVDISRSVLPSVIPGCSGHGSNTVQASGFGGLSGQTVTGFWANTVHIAQRLQNITMSIDLGREDIFELGSKRPFAKYATFPVQTSLSIEVVSPVGDLIEASAGLDCVPDTISYSTCIVRTCEGLQVDLGDNLMLDSIDQGGGGTDGGNLTATYNFKGFNTFNVSHDFWMPQHRVVVQRTTGSRFNLS